MIRRSATHRRFAVHQSPRASLFPRLLLSHLLLLLACLIAGLGVVLYLFPEQIGLYLIRSPIIILPLVLGLLGLAGLLANWSAGSVTLPLDRLASVFRAPDPLVSLLTDVPDASVQEIEHLHRILLAWEHHRGSLEHQKSLRLARAARRDVIVMDTDEAGRILDANPLVEHATGYPLAHLVGQSVAILMPNDASSLAALLDLHRLVWRCPMALLSASGLSFPVRWSALSRYNDQGDAVGRTIMIELDEPMESEEAIPWEEESQSEEHARLMGDVRPEISTDKSKDNSLSMPRESRSPSAPTDDPDPVTPPTES